MLKNTNADSDLKRVFTVGSFLINPTGDAGHSVGQRKLVLEDIRKRMDILRKANHKFTRSYFAVGQDVYIKIGVPSETFPELSYDVVIKFKDVNLESTSILTSEIEFFSNSPSFCFTYAYTFNLFEIFIKELSKKLDPKSLTELPAVRNPDAVIFYEKTITMALIYIKDNDLCNTSTIKSSLVRLPKTKFFEKICPSADEKMEEYKKLKKIESDKKKAERKVKSVKEPKKTTISVADRDMMGEVEIALKGSTKRKFSTQSDKRKSASSTKVNNKVDNKVDNKVKNRTVNNKI